jgi:Tfp pilus assembly protein PilF
MGILNRLDVRILPTALLIAAPFVVYSNNYRHAFHLDDAYTLVSNPSVRTLSAVPRYFVDPATYTSVREQADYRPLLQVSYALNYWMGGYDTWWWHFTQILLHTLVTLGIYALCRRVLVIMRDPRPDGIAFVAALIFAIHPAASGVVNYLNARSSLLTAVFILPALLAYMKPIEEEEYARPQWLAALFYALALFTKVEAVGALGAFCAFELWQRGREAPAHGFLRAVRATLDRRTVRRLAPALAITAVYFVIRWRVMSPFPFGDSRHAADVGAYEYFLTQLTAWWYYVLRLIAPVRLVADYLSYPVYRSWADPVVLFALGGWVLVGALLIAAWRRAPYLAFLAVTALALLSPTSSIAPLAEMVNEHRPYLPMGVLSLALIIPAGMLLRHWPRGSARAAVTAGVIVIVVALSALTYRRNEVFSTSERFWKDVLAKAPSARAHLNYGVSLMAANDMSEAMRQFQKSLEFAPRWYFTQINMGVAYRSLGQTDRAREHFDRAVEYDRFSGLALSWRGEFHLGLGEFAAARDDFLRSLPLSLERYRNARGLATAYAGLGDVPRCLEQTDRMRALDSAAAMADLPSVRACVPSRGADAKSQESQMAAGLDFLGKGDPVAAAAKFREVLAVNPTHYGAHYQLAVALDRAGRRSDARPLWEKVLRMAEGYHDLATARAARTRLNQKP